MTTATQVESFCESCGTRYAFEPRRPRGRHLVRVGRLVGILPDEADIDSSALVVSRDPFHGAFHFCLECRRFTCPSCWDTSRRLLPQLRDGHRVRRRRARSPTTRPDPETEAILQAALDSLLRLGSTEGWHAPRAATGATGRDLGRPTGTGGDSGGRPGPMIEAGLAALGAKALAESERAEAEAEQRRLAEELRLEEERLVAEQAEQVRLAQEAAQAQLVYEAQPYGEPQPVYEAQPYGSHSRSTRPSGRTSRSRSTRPSWSTSPSRTRMRSRTGVAQPEDEPQLAAAAILAQEADQARLAYEAQASRLAPEDEVGPPAPVGPDDLVMPAELVGLPASSAHEPEDAPEAAVDLGRGAGTAARAARSTMLLRTRPGCLRSVLGAACRCRSRVPNRVDDQTRHRATDRRSRPSPPDAICRPSRRRTAVSSTDRRSLRAAARRPAASSRRLCSPGPMRHRPRGQPPAPVAPVMPPGHATVPPPPPPQVAWQITAPPRTAPCRGHRHRHHRVGCPPQMPMPSDGHAGSPREMAVRGSPPLPSPGPVKGGVRPCPRCDLPLSGQARFCRRCGLPQT